MVAVVIRPNSELVILLLQNISTVIVIVVIAIVIIVVTVATIPAFEYFITRNTLLQ